MSEAFDWIEEEHDELMRASEVKEILRCGQRQVYEFLDRNPDLKIKISQRSIRVIRDRFIEWLENGGEVSEEAA